MAILALRTMMETPLLPGWVVMVNAFLGLLLTTVFIVIAVIRNLKKNRQQVADPTMLCVALAFFTLGAAIPLVPLLLWLVWAVLPEKRREKVREAFS